jgi:hypothetical protein
MATFVESPKKEKSLVPVIDTSPTGLIALAVDKDLDIEKLHKLIEMKNANDAKVAKMEFLNALSKFQGIVPPLVKNKTADYGEGKAKYNFHQLPDIEKHIRPSLKECGLSYRWGQKEDGGNISVWLLVAHTGGHEEVGDPISGGLDNSGSKNLIQQKASTITYLRRYTLTGGLGISSGDADDDGSKGQKTAPGGLPYLKDAQLGQAIKAIMEGKYTFDKENTVLKVDSTDKVKVTEKHIGALQKAQEEYNSKQK